MPFSINSFGSGFFRASKKRKIEGHTQYDAIEAMMGLFLPVLPIKVIHIADVTAPRMVSLYHCLPLKFAPRIVLKAFLRRWGSVLIWIGLPLAVLLTSAQLRKGAVPPGAFFLTCSYGILLVAVLMLLTLRKMDRRDERIKDIIGPHSYGSADPIYWPDDVADKMVGDLLERCSCPSLLHVARLATSNRNPSLAMMSVRLLMRKGEDVEASQLFEQLLMAHESV